MLNSTSQIRWVSQHTLVWNAPFLSFERRKLELLDWLDSRSDATSMRSTDDLFGVGFPGPSRIQIHRGGMMLECLSPDALLPSSDVVMASCDLMGASTVSLDHLTGLWTVPLAGLPYAEACSTFAEKMVPVGPGSSIAVFDAATLFDARVANEAGGGTLKIEFGMVTPSEIETRCLDQVGMLQSLRPRGASVDTSAQPETSLLAEAVWTPHPAVVAPESLGDACSKMEVFIGDTLLRLAQRLYDEV